MSAEPVTPIITEREPAALAAVDRVAVDRVAADPTCAPSDAPTGPIAPPDDETLAVLAKALGHPARIRILRVLGERQTCITRDVVDELPLAQSTVSEHLRILREADLVQASSDGTSSVYCLSPSGLQLLKAGIAAL